MSVIERAQRARYYQLRGFPLSSLSIFNLQEAKTTRSLQYLEQVTNLCQKIKLGPQQYDKQSTSNKLKILKAFQYSILYSHNLKAIYDSKECQLKQKNTELQQQIRDKKQAIKLHKQKVDKRKAQYRQMKVDYAKNAYQTFSNQISNLKIKQEELNVIKLQLHSQIQIAKQQLNSPYYPPVLQPPIPPQSPNYPYNPDPSSFPHPFTMSNYNSFPKQSTPTQPNNFSTISPQLNNPNQGQKLFYEQNIQQQRGSKLKTQQSNFTLNGSWTVLDEQNRIQEMNAKNSRQQSNMLASYQIKVLEQKKDSKGKMIYSNSKKLRINTQISNQDQPQVLSSPTTNFILPNSPDKIKPLQQQDSSSFDDLNTQILAKQSLVDKKSNVQQKKSMNSSMKQQSRQTSKIHENDSLLLRRLKQESNISKKSSQSSVEYKFQDEIKQTPNLNYYLQSNNHISNDLSYSKMGDLEGDIWASTKGSTEGDISNMKMFNFQPKRKPQDQQNARNTIQSYKQSNSIEGSESKQLNHIDVSDVNSFDKLDDELDDLDLGMDTRNSIIQITVDKKSKVENSDTMRKTENNYNNKKQFDVSINTLEEVPQQSDSELMKRDSIPLPPALNKTQEKDYYEQEYYDEQFQDQLQESKKKGVIQQSIKNKRQPNSDYKSEVEIHVPSNASFAEINNSIVKHEHVFKDIPNETFSPKDQRFKNNSNGIFADLQNIIDIQNKSQTQQLNSKSERSIVNNEESQFEDSFDLPQATTIGKKPKTPQKQSLSNLDQSERFLILQHPLESKVIPRNDDSQSTLNNQKEPIGKKYLDNHELTASIPLKNSTQIHQQESIMQENQDSISQQIEYQFEDSSKFNQSQKQQIQRKIISLLRNKNKTKNNNQLPQKIKSKQQQIKARIDQEISQNIINQSNLKGKQQDWKQVARIFQNKINELKKQSSSSQINKKLSEIEQKGNNSDNKKSNSGSKENSGKNSKLLKQNTSQSDENVELNYSQSVLKDQLKPQLKNKSKMDLSSVQSANENMTNSSNIKNESLSLDDSLGYSLGLKSNLGLKNQEKEKVSQNQMKESKQQSAVLKKPPEEKAYNLRQNKLMGVQKQQQKVQQVCRSKYVKFSNSKTTSSIPKQSAFTKISESKYVSIEDPLNNQIAKRKPAIKQKVPDDDDDDF